MAWTQTDVDALKGAIAALGRGELVRRVRYSDGSEAEYSTASLPIMKDVLAMMQAEVSAAAQPARRTYRSIRVTPRSGY